ncbi:HAD family hydrolase [Saccharopolyspora gregorii]|uniref:HAD family hydrolase n=1 Tax=Saccharopolyspora gregorii TaxID=33914 RepID=UPI0031E8150E
MPDPAWKPRLVALDVDGTLLDPDAQTISPPVRDAVRRAAAAGAHVVIATGRSMLGTVPVLRELGLTGGVALCSNGAVLLDAATGDALAVETFDPAPVHARLAPLLPGASYAVEQVGTGSLVTSPFREYQLHGPQRLASSTNWSRHPCRGSSRTGRTTRRRRSSTRSPTPSSPLHHHHRPLRAVGDGGARRRHQGAALEKLRTELGVSTEDTFAAGDGTNDVQMLRWAAHSVAMGQPPTRCAPPPPRSPDPSPRTAWSPRSPAVPLIATAGRTARG